MKERNKKENSRPVKYVYLDKYERQQNQINGRLDALAELIAKQQQKTRRVQWIIVAILCASILSGVIFF